MHLKKAIILAGGEGTRIRTVEGKKPKSLIQVTDKPILFYILEHLKHYGFEEFIFSLGRAKANRVIGAIGNELTRFSEFEEIYTDGWFE